MCITRLARLSAKAILPFSSSQDFLNSSSYLALNAVELALALERDLQLR